MRRFATHSTRVAPELSTQLRIVFSLLSIRIFESSDIEEQHLELYHRGSIDLSHRAYIYITIHACHQEMKPSGFGFETTLWHYQVLVYE